MKNAPAVEGQGKLSRVGGISALAASASRRAERFLSCFAYVWRLVHLRQTFARRSHGKPAYMGPMPTSSTFKAVARPSGGDARGVAGAVHADALQQWRQTAP